LGRPLTLLTHQHTHCHLHCTSAASTVVISTDSTDDSAARLLDAKEPFVFQVKRDAFAFTLRGEWLCCLRCSHVFFFDVFFDTESTKHCFRLHRMREMQTIVTDDRCVCLSVCLSRGSTPLHCAGFIRCSLCQITLASCLLSGRIECMICGLLRSMNLGVCQSVRQAALLCKNS